MRLFLLLIAISLVCIGLQFEPQASLVNWHRQAIIDGQWWRILSGNFTHTNLAHLAMNLAGLWVICFIFKPSVKTLVFSLFMLSALIGIINFTTDMVSYVGLSAVLHGLFATFAIMEALQGRRSSWLLVGGVLAKVIWENTVGASTSTTELIQATVAVESHLIGAVSGLCIGVLLVKSINLTRAA